MLANLSFPMVVILACAGICLDLMLGEVRHWHPLAGFGKMAIWTEQKLNRGRFTLVTGAFAWALVVLPVVILSYVAMIWRYADSVWLYTLPHVLLLYFALGLRSLYDHTWPIQQALQANKLAHARLLTARIVSRDTAHADVTELSKTTVESLLENGNDAVFATIFWFIVAGGAGALLYRLVNTLDAMWGYRSVRYEKFGKLAARIDDVMNWIPARLTAVSYALLGHTRQALCCWRTQAPHWPSPNAGPILAAGAGALNLALGRSATYDGVIEDRPALGMGHPVSPADIRLAWQLILRTTILWLALLLACAIIVH